MTYITIPIETDPEDLIADAVASIQAKFPGWEPADGNLDYWIIQAVASQAAELRDVSSAVTDAIFRYFGETVMGIPPIDAQAATTTSTWTMVDNAGYTIPAGTQVGIRTAGDELIPFYVQSDVVIPPGATATAVGAVTLVAVNAGAEATNIGTFGGPVELIDPLTYVVTITSVAPTTGGVDAEADDVYLNRLSDYLTLLAPRPILPSDFAIMARSVAGVTRATALDGYNPSHNKLTLNQASLETDTAGWQAGANATIARSTAQALDGVASLAITSVAAGSYAAQNPIANAIPALPGEYWGAIASLRGSIARTAQIVIQFYDAANVFISQVSSVATAYTTTGWTLFAIGGTAPANTAKAVVQLVGLGAAAGGEVLYADKISLRRGPGSDWVPGGTPETGNERMVTVAVVDALGNAVSTPVKSAVQTLLSSRREINFVVSVIDPTYTTIDVNYTIRIMSGFDSTDVIARVNDALTQFLSPYNWGGDFFSTGVVSEETWLNQSIVRYLELAQVINNVVGVDYIILLQSRISGGVFASVDLSVGGAIPLIRPGVMTGTAA